MMTVDQYQFIRMASKKYGKSIRQISRDYGHHRGTIRKALRGEAPKYKMEKPRKCPVMDDVKHLIDQWLCDNGNVHRTEINWACLEDLHYDKHRGLDKNLILSLASCGWIRESHNVLIRGATGVGKSFLGCALGHRACLEGFRVAYLRTPRLLRDLNTSKGDGGYAKLLEKWPRTDVLILDDWGDHADE